MGICLRHQPVQVATSSRGWHQKGPRLCAAVSVAAVSVCRALLESPTLLTRECLVKRTTKQMANMSLAANRQGPLFCEGLCTDHLLLSASVPPAADRRRWVRKRRRVALPSSVLDVAPAGNQGTETVPRRVSARAGGQHTTQNAGCCMATHISAGAAHHTQTQTHVPCVYQAESCGSVHAPMCCRCSARSSQVAACPSLRTGSPTTSSCRSGRSCSTNSSSSVAGRPAPPAQQPQQRQKTPPHMPGVTASAAGSRVCCWHP